MQVSSMLVAIIAVPAFSDGADLLKVSAKFEGPANVQLRPRLTVRKICVDP